MVVKPAMASPPARPQVGLGNVGLNCMHQFVGGGAKSLGFLLISPRPDY